MSAGRPLAAQAAQGDYFVAGRSTSRRAIASEPSAEALDRHAAGPQLVGRYLRPQGGEQRLSGVLGIQLGVRLADQQHQVSAVGAVWAGGQATTRNLPALGREHYVHVAGDVLEQRAAERDQSLAGQGRPARAARDRG